jgi:hypothetical protein
MGRWFRLIAITILATATLLGLGIASGNAGSHPHVYLFRGLAVHWPGRTPNPDFGRAFVRFTPESGHSSGIDGTSALCQKQTCTYRCSIDQESGRMAPTLFRDLPASKRLADGVYGRRLHPI